MYSLIPATHVAARISFVGATSRVRNAALALFSIAVLLAGVGASARGQSALDGFNPNANDVVRAVVVQPDGRILIGGDFTALSPDGGAAVTRNHIARLNPDGTLDTGLDPNANDIVRSIAVQADGKILIGGDFTALSPNGGAAVTRNHIARLNPDGTLDTAFDPNANDTVRSIAMQADGKILAGGTFTTIGRQPRNRIARLDAATGLADSFDPNATSYVETIVVQADGRILVGGDFNGPNSIGEAARNRIARLFPGSGLADPFDPDADNVVNSIAVQADNKILAGGSFTTIGGQPRHHIARLDATTGKITEPADVDFDPNATGSVFAIVVQADGRILVGGDFNGANSIGGADRDFIARLDPLDGAADSTFNANANNDVFTIAVQADGFILAGGFGFDGVKGIDGQTRNGIARLQPDGSLDQTLNNLGIVPPTLFGVLATAIQPDGKILVGGDFSSALGVTRNNIARLNRDGTLDTDFDPNANGNVFSIAVQADRTILVGGAFTAIGGLTRHFIARLDVATGLPDSFNPDANDELRSIVVQAPDKILVGGFFTSIGGQPRHRIARLDATGMADSFDPDANDIVESIAVQADGKILAGGYFTNIDGQPRNRIARLDMDGALDADFNPNANNIVFAIAVQADSKILAGGQFTSMSGQTRNRIARLNADGTLDTAFNPNAGSPEIGVRSIAVQADDKIVAAGFFTSMGGQPRNYIARLHMDGTLDAAFNPNANSVVYTIEMQDDGKILAGGRFTSMGGQTRSLFARLSNDTAALQNLAVTQTTITWTRSGSSTQFTRVTFESSTDNVNYSPLGGGTAVGSNWTLTGLNLPTGENFYIRARGHYRSGYANGSESITESVRNVFLAPPSHLGNISTRLRLPAADVLIGGLIATGTAGKRVIIRAIGPSLTGFGIPGALADPTLELFQGDTRVFSNDDWRNSTQQGEIELSGLQPNRDAESAIIWTLTPGQNYTALVREKNGQPGIGVVEAFDLDPAAASKLGNLSSRGFVGVEDSVMIAGFIVVPGNGASLKILARALGPTLGDFGVPGVLENPVLDLVNASGTVIRSNNNWKDDQRSEIEAAGLAPNYDEEAALVETVSPGAYTAIVRGIGATPTGVGLVEVYDIP